MSIIRRKRSIAELRGHSAENNDPNLQSANTTDLKALEEQLYWKVPKVTINGKREIFDLTVSEAVLEQERLERTVTLLDPEVAFISSVASNEASFPLRAVSILLPKLFSFYSVFSEPRWSSSCFRDSLFNLTGGREVIFFDTETTGIYKHDRIIEVAFVYRNYETMLERRWYSLINPQGKKSSRGAFKVHKIPNESLTSQRCFADMIDDIMRFIGDTIPLIAHNASFDRIMFNQELSKLHHPLLPKSRFICTYQQASKLRGRVKGLNSLDQLCKDYHIDSSSRCDYHGAMQDTLLLADLYPFLMVDSALILYKAEKATQGCDDAAVNKDCT